LRASRGSVHFKGVAWPEKPVKHGKTRSNKSVDFTGLSEIKVATAEKQKSGLMAAPLSPALLLEANHSTYYQNVKENVQLSSGD